jgi:hypothetical protein
MSIIISNSSSSSGGGGGGGGSRTPSANYQPSKPPLTDHVNGI